MEDLVKINNACCLFQKRFLERGGYFAVNRTTSEKYFTYLLSHDKLEIFNEHLQKGSLEIDEGNLLDKNKEEIVICAHDFWVHLKERMNDSTPLNGLSLFIISSGVNIITCRPCKSDWNMMEENTDTMVCIIRNLLKSKPFKLVKRKRGPRKKKKRVESREA
ncbi:Hypothetical protein BQ3484_206 [Cedratvirus A11]|uniref:Uncharacterized protein n=1 Tax=Cedratvirus A11 TaxID=1903266 RepID=A0A1M7XUA1_9VIRU|nr:Hypothetical protein BQ3484_206 [Cedratvirus A11]SHO33274.1 Hypothetical protein BQ3484_206 [Cedratvirus A11]